MSTPAFLSHLPRLTMTPRRWRYALVACAVIPSLVLVLDAAAVFSEE